MEKRGGTIRTRRRKKDDEFAFKRKKGGRASWRLRMNRGKKRQTRVSAPHSCVDRKGGEEKCLLGADEKGRKEEISPGEGKEHERRGLAEEKIAASASPSVLFKKKEEEKLLPRKE